MDEYKSFYNTIDDRKANTWCKYTKRLDTYGCGCFHDCSYCYAKSLLYFRGYWNPDKPKRADVSKIRNRISTLKRTDTVKLGGMTDCFQPIERTHRTTLKTVMLLNKFRINYLIVTKSDLVASDEYIKHYDKDLAHFQITITNTDNRKYEKASTLKKRIAAIEKLYRLGFDVSIRLSPFIAEYINLSIINSIECGKILIEFLKVNHYIEKQFTINYSNYNLKYGGYKHLSLNEKIYHVSNITGYEKSVGEFVKDHHIYFRDNVNHNKDDCCNLTNNRLIQSDTQKTLF